MNEQDISAYFMMDGFVYAGKPKYQKEDGEKIILDDFIIMPTIKIAQDKRAPEVVISEAYEGRNKGSSTTLSLKNKVSFSNIILALKGREIN